MARSFLYAGARALLASYWRVSDEATSALTVEYVRSQMAGADRFDSLQQAERAIRTGQGTDGKRIANWQPDWAHPVYWAPFSVISAGSGSALR